MPISIILCTIPTKMYSTYQVGYQSLTVILCTISTSYRGMASNVSAKLEGINIDEK